MKKIGFLFILGIFCFYAQGYSQGVPAQNVAVEIPAEQVIKTVDVNKDGSADVRYYRDSKYVSKAEADTNYDGKADVVVYAKNGEFVSAEVDTNYDGKTDKKFTDVKEFNQWLNKNNPDFESKLNQPNWQFDLMKF